MSFDLNPLFHAGPIKSRRLLVVQTPSQKKVIYFSGQQCWRQKLDGTKPLLSRLGSEGEIFLRGFLWWEKRLVFSTLLLHATLPKDICPLFSSACFSLGYLNISVFSSLIST